jgi:GntR family transcriptional regulator/MocR family aminotransferase
MSIIFSFTPLLDNTINKPIYYQLYEYIKEEILNGNIKGEAKLPSLRKLSQYLNLSKNTVEAAYQQLYAEGYIESIPKIGYRVVDIHSNLFEVSKPSKNIIAETESFKADKNYKFDFAPRYVDKSCFNINIWKKISNCIINEEFESLLCYGDPQGEYALRQEITKYIYEARGVHCHPNQIIIGAGTQYCLSLLCQMLRPNHEAIGMEDPGSNWIRFIFESYQFHVDPIAVHEQGLNVSQLEHGKSKIVFVTPSHQFPKGVIMSASNRLQLLNWAQNNNGIIIEDDYDSEIRFSGKPVPSLKSLDKNDQVIYLGSFSKIFIPTIRISYMILPHKLLNLYLEKCGMYTQTTSKLNQMALARFMKEGYWQSHIRKIRRHYLNKYNIITKAIQTHVKDNVNLISSSAGLRVVLEVKTNLTEDQIVTVARNAGINISPISQHYISPNNYKQDGSVKVLLSYKGISIEDIEPAIKAFKPCMVHLRHLQKNK